jgi:hypothetical protein
MASKRLSGQTPDTLVGQQGLSKMLPKASSVFTFIDR